MSDTWQGPGWRRADDGKWYPTGEPEPESSPDPSPEPERSPAEAGAVGEPSPPEALPPPPDGGTAPRPESVPAGSVSCELCHRPMDATALRCPRCGQRRQPPTAPMPADDWVS